LVAADFLLLGRNARALGFKSAFLLFPTSLCIVKIEVQRAECAILEATNYHSPHPEIT